MPCDQIRYTTTELRHADEALLAQAIEGPLRAAGYIYWGHRALSGDAYRAKLAENLHQFYDGETLRLPANVDLGEVKRNYATLTVTAKLDRFQWRVTTRVDKAGRTQIVAQKRR